MSPCSLSLFCRPSNRRATTATCCPRSWPQSTSSPWPQPQSAPLPSSSSSHMCASLGHCHAAAVAIKLDPASLRAHHRRRPQPHLPRSVPLLSTSTPPPSEHAATVDLDPASLRACHRCPLPQALDTASGKGDTPPLPHYYYHLVRYLLPYMTVCVNMNEIWLCLEDLSEFDWIKLIALLILVDFMEFIESLVNFSRF
jgi:hypothetical protein